LSFFSVAGNHELCMTGSCKKKNIVVPLVASFTALFLIILIISLGLRIFKRQKGICWILHVVCPLYSFIHSFGICWILNYGHFFYVIYAKHTLFKYQNIYYNQLSLKLQIYHIFFHQTINSYKVINEGNNIFKISHKLKFMYAL